MNAAYFLFILHRALSGWRNGTFYTRLSIRETAWPRLLATVVMFALVATIYLSTGVITPDWLPVGRDVQYPLVVLAYAATLASTVLCARHHLFPAPWNDLHFFTLAEQSLLAGAMIVAVPTLDMLVVLALSVYPSVFLQKVGVNLSGGAPWYYNGTDDPTGKTYALPIFGWKVPRLTTQYGKLILAIVSTILYFCYNLFI